MTAGLTALLSHWLRHPLQLAMLMLGLALATALWSGVQAINAEARASYDRAAAVLGQNRLDRIEAGDGGPIAQDLYVALRREGWRVSPVVEGRLPGTGLRLLGIDPLTLPPGAASVPVSTGADLGRFLSGDGLIYLNPDTAAALRPDDGLPDLQSDPGLPPGTGVSDIGVAQRLLGMEGKLSYLLVTPGRQPDGPLPQGLVRRAPDGGSDITRLTDSFHLNLTAFGFLAFAVGLFIVNSAIGLAFEQRRAMFRTLRALGLSARGLIGIVLLELLVLSLVSGAIGIGLGYLVAAALLPDVAATLRGLYGAEVTGTLSLRPGWWLAGLGIAMAGTLLAAGQSLWRLWHLPLLAPAQPRAWALASARSLWRQGLAGAGLLGLSAGLLAFGTGLTAGVGGLAALLIGAALCLPVILILATGLGSRLARGVLVQWFWADTRQQVPGLSLALMALLLALAANIGVGTMVSSFRQTFVGWLDQRLASELYITARSAGEARRLEAWLAPRTDAVLPILSAETPLFGRPGEVYGIADHATYRDNWPLLSATPDVWDRIAAGQGLMVNEQLYRAEGLALGDAVDLPGGPLPVVGVYSDYGNPKPQVLIAPEALMSRFPDTPRLRFGLRVAPNRAEALATALVAGFGLPEDAVVDQASLKALSLQIFERTFAVTAALNVLTLGVAGLAMFASLLTLSGLRLPQLAPVWAMGLTRQRLALLEFARTLLLAALTLMAALPLGLALAWVLLAVVNVAAFGWRLPMQVFPGDLMQLGGIALLAAGVASLIPVLRLARIAPASLLRVFANER
jgi:putative ABC transport system permease protein